MDLFGGKIAPAASLVDRIKKDASSASGMDSLALILTIPKHHTNNSNALVWDEGATISGDFVLDTNQKWLKKNEISLLVSFGDFRIDGDFLNNDEHFWPVVYIGGSMFTCNVLKGGAPLVVRENVNASGYFIGEFNDGPLLVGGDLNSLGYIPLARDRKELKAHNILGHVNAHIFNGALDFSRNDLKRAVSDEEVLTYKWFDIDKLFEKGRQGKSIWRQPDQPFEEQPPVILPPLPVLTPVDPTRVGALTPSTGRQDELVQLIREKIPLNPEGYSYPESFAEYVRIHLRDHAGDNILVLPPGSKLDGDLQLDWEAPWAEQNSISTIICLGDLTINGTVRNRMLEGGPMLFVGGTLFVKNLIKSGATVIVLGDVIADGLVIGEYNDGVTRIGGNLQAQCFILLDHDGFVRGEVRATHLSDDDVEFRDVMVESVFPSEDDTMPDVELLWAHHEAKRPILIGAD